MKGLTFILAITTLTISTLSCKTDHEPMIEKEVVLLEETSKDDGSNPNNIINNLGIDASNFINKHFHNSEILEIKNSTDGFRALLNNGVDIEFDINGEVITINTNNDSNSLPNGILPTQILSYLKSLKIDPFNITNYQFKDQEYKITIDNSKIYYFTNTLQPLNK